MSLQDVLQTRGHEETNPNFIPCHGSLSTTPSNPGSVNFQGFSTLLAHTHLHMSGAPLGYSNLGRGRMGKGSREPRGAPPRGGPGGGALVGVVPDAPPRKGRLENCECCGSGERTPYGRWTQKVKGRNLNKGYMCLTPIPFVTYEW